MLQPQHGQGNLAGFGTGQAHYPDPAAARRRGHGYDGIVQVHRFILVGGGLDLSLGLVAII
jgi:hypothetical protein